MKTFLSLLILCSWVSAFAAPSEDKCFKRAASAVANKVEKDVYDQDGFETSNCELASNRQVFLCEVAAYKGGGAAVDTYRAVLNAKCTAAYRVDLIGEE